MEILDMIMMSSEVSRFSFIDAPINVKPNRGGAGKECGFH